MGLLLCMEVTEGGEVEGGGGEAGRRKMHNIYEALSG